MEPDNGHRRLDASLRAGIISAAVARRSGWE